MMSSRSILVARCVFSTKWLGPAWRSRPVVALAVLLGGFAFPGGLAHGDDMPQVTAEKPRPSRTVYLPIEELDQLLSQESAGVLLPRADFLKLQAEAEASRLKHPPEEVATAVVSTDYALEWQEHALKVALTAELRQFQPGWQLWSLPLSGLVVTSARLNDQPADLARDANHQLQLLTQTVGTHRLVLEAIVTTATTGSDRRGTFGLLPSPVGKMTLTLPAGNRLLLADRNLARPAPMDQPASYTFAIGGQKEIQLQVTNRTEEHFADTLTFASTLYQVQAAPGEIGWQAQTSLQIFGRKVDLLTLTVPASLEVAEVTAPGLDRWELADADDGTSRTKIQLAFSQAFDGERTLRIRGILPVPQNQWTVPDVDVLDVTSQMGRIEIAYPPGIRLREISTRGVQRRQINDLANKAANYSPEAGLQYEAYQPGFVLELQTEVRQQSLHAAMASILDVHAEGLDWTTVLTVIPSGHSLYETRLMAPVEWELLSIEHAGRSLDWQAIPAEAGQQVYSIRFPKPLAEKTPAVLQLNFRRLLDQWPPAPGKETEFLLPAITLPDAGLVETALVLRGDDDLEFKPMDLVGLESLPLKESWERLRFQAQTVAYSGKLNVRRQPVQLSTELIVYARLDRSTTVLWQKLNLEILGGGTRTVTILVPAEAGPNWQFQTQPPFNLVEQTVSPPENGVHKYFLRFAERLTGTVELLVDDTQPRPESAAWQIPLPCVEGADRQTGYIALEADPDQRLAIDARYADGSAVAPADPLDLPHVPYQPRQRLVSVLQFTRPNANITISEERFIRVGVPSAVCPRLTMDSYYDRSGLMTNRGHYLLKTAGIQSLQLSLPVGAELWSVLLDGQPVELRRQFDDRYLIPLTATSQKVPDHREVTVHYRVRQTPLKLAGWMEQRLPQIFAQNGAGAIEQIDVLEHTWNVAHPPETWIDQAEGPLEATTPLDQETFWQRLRSLRMAKGDDLAFRTILILGTVTLLGLLSLAIKRRRWFLGVVSLMFAGFVFACIAVFSLVLGGLGVPREYAATPATAAALVQTESKAAEEEVVLSESQQQTQPYFDQLQVDGAMGRNSASLPPPMSPEAPSDDRVLSKQVESAPTNTPVSPAADPFGTPFPRGAGQPISPVMPSNDVPILNRIPSVTRLPVQPPQNSAATPPEPTSQAALADAQQNRKKSGAVLSVPIDHRPPAGYHEKSFAYAGNQGFVDQPALKFHYVDQTTSRNLQRFLIVLGICLGWVMRCVRKQLQLSIAIVLFALIMAIIPQLEATLPQIILEGLLLGLFAAAVTIALCRLTTCCLSHLCQFRPDRATRALPTTAVLLATLTGSSVFAAEPESQLAPTPSKAPQLPGAPVEIMPYATGQEPTANDRVWIPQAEFLKLWQLAHPEFRKKTPAPRAGSVAQADFVAKLQPGTQATEASVAIQARFTIIWHQSQPGSLELPLTSCALTSARWAEGDAVVTFNEKGQATVLVPKPGVQILDLQLSTPARQVGEIGSFAVPISPTASGQLSWELPGADLAVRVDGSSTNFRQIEREGRQWIDFPIAHLKQPSIVWQPTMSRTTTAALFQASSTSTARLDDTGLLLESLHHYRVRQGGLPEVSLAIPPIWRVRNVTGSDVGGWELQETDQGRELKVFLRRAVTDSTAVSLKLFQPLSVKPAEATAASLQLPSTIGVPSEAGLLNVFAAPQFNVQTTSSQGLIQIAPENANPLGGPKTEPPLSAWKTTKRPASLELSLSRRTPQLAVSVQHAVALAARQQTTQSTWTLELGEFPQNTFHISLPANFVLLDVQVPGLQDSFLTEASDGRQNLSLEIQKATQSRLQIITIGRILRDAPSSQEVPLPQFLDAHRNRQETAVWLDESVTANLADKGGWQVIDPAELSQALRQQQPQAPQFAFQTLTAAPANFQFALSRKSPRLQATSLTTVNIREAGTVFGFAWQWTIQEASVDQFQLRGPAALLNRIKFDGPGLRNVDSRDLQNGQAEWTVFLRGPVAERYFLTAVATTSSEDLQLTLPTFELGTTTSNGWASLETQRHYGLLDNSSQSQLVLVDPQALETVPVSDIPIIIRPELARRATQIFRVKSLSTPVVWNRVRHTQMATLPASVNLADLVTVVARDGTYRGLATWTVRNRSRQFLAVRLPAETRLESVFVNEQPARAMQTHLAEKPTLLIPLPKTSGADRSFPVQIVWAGQLAKSLPDQKRLVPTELTIPPPVLVSQTESEDFGIPVARTRWTLYLPEDLSAKPATNPTLHNLNVASQQNEDEVIRMALIADYTEQIQILEGTANGAMKQRALDNAREIESLLQDSTKSWYDNEDFSSKESGNSWGTLLGSSKQRSSRTLRELGAKDNASSNSSSDSYSDALAAVIAGNGLLVTDNSAKTLFENSGTVEFSIVDKPQKEMPKLEAKGEVSAEKDQSEARLFFRQQNDEQLSRLNTATQRRRTVTGLAVQDTAQNANPAPASAIQTAVPQRNVAAPTSGVAGQTQAAPPTQQGLSLSFEIPRTGQKLLFTKTGGEPRLTVYVSGRHAWSRLATTLWSLLWIGVAGGLLLGVLHPSRRRFLLFVLCNLLAAYSLVFLLTTAGGMVLLAWGLFSLSAMLLYGFWLFPRNRISTPSSR